MESYVPVSLLKPHPKNKEYFSEPSPEKREEIKRSVAAHGIRDPLKVAPDFTVIAGHLRLEIARELGLEKVPVEIVDGDPLYLEYLLVADNEERRVCEDPVKKARRAKFLKEYWDVRQGRPEKSRQNVVVNSGKTMKDVAEAIGESERTAQRLLKLNDLIPPLQDLVSQGKLGQTLAYSLASLPQDAQEELLRVLGESGVCGLSVKEAQELRRELEAERKRAGEAARRLAEAEKALAAAEEGSAEAERLRAEVEALRRENEELKARRPEIVERVVEKTVEIPVEKEIVRPDPAAQARLEAARKEIARLSREIEVLQGRLAVLAEDGERERSRAEALKREKEDLERRLENMKRRIEELEKGEPLPEIPLKKEIERAGSLAAELLNVLDAILRRPEKLRKLCEAAAVAAVQASSDPFEDLAAAAGEFIPRLVLGHAEATLRLAGAKIAGFLEALAELRRESPRLRVVKN